MRLLLLSNIYPPFARGGYEQWCAEVAGQLAQRGHLVCVLTSGAADRASADPSRAPGVEVHRRLHLEVEAGLLHTAVRLVAYRRRLEQENLKQVQRLVAGFRPTAAMIWGMWNVPRSVPALVERLLAGSVVYYLCDYWLTLPDAYVQQLELPSRRPVTRRPKQLLSRLLLTKAARAARQTLGLEHPVCVSRAVRERLTQAGVPVEHADIIYGGVEASEFATAATGRRQGAPGGGLKLLYAGRLTPEKGVHTAIQAMALLAGHDQTTTLDVIGGGDTGYVRELKALAQQGGLAGRVRFRGRVSRDDMPALLAAYDALVFPSEWQEPFARIVLEAMAAGTVVIGTTTGGTSEVLVDGQTGLTFSPGDAAALAAQIRRLADDASLRGVLAGAGRQVVRERFTLEQMVGQIEAVLQRAAESSERRARGTPLPEGASPVALASGGQGT